MPTFGGVTGRVYYKAWRVLPRGQGRVTPTATWSPGGEDGRP
jgi:hypothetical protein